MTNSQKQRLKPLLKKLMMEVKNELREDYYRISKFKVDLNSLIDRALESNDHDEVISVLKHILSHRFNQ